MGQQRMDADTAESTAGVVRLLRRAAELAWSQADAQGPSSPRQLLALGIDLAADEARNVLPDGVNIDGAVPVGVDPVGLLRSAEQLLRRLSRALVGIHVQSQISRCLVVPTPRRLKRFPRRPPSVYRKVRSLPHLAPRRGRLQITQKSVLSDGQV